MSSIGQMQHRQLELDCPIAVVTMSPKDCVRATSPDAGDVETYNRASEQMRKKSAPETKSDLFLEITYIATGAMLAIALSLNVHLSPKFIGPAGTVLCSNVACLA